MYTREALNKAVQARRPTVDTVNRQSSTPARLPDVRLQPSAEVLFREILGEGVLLNLETGEYYGLNRVATLMWKALAETGSPAAARDRLLTLLDVDDERLTSDLATFIGQMEKAGLVAHAAAA
jgi:hypothetical protein